MAGSATILGQTKTTGSTTVTVSSVTPSGSTTNLAAPYHTSASAGAAAISTFRWDVGGTPQNLTADSDGTFYTGNDARNGIGYLHSPNIATDDCQLVMDATQDELSLSLYEVTGCDSAIRTSPTPGTGSSSTPSITHTGVQTDDAIIYCYSGIETDLSGNTITISSHNSGQTQGADQGHPFVGFGSSFEASGGTSESGGATFSESIEYRICALAFQVTAAGGLGIPIAAYHHNHNVGSKL